MRDYNFVEKLCGRDYVRLVKKINDFSNSEKDEKMPKNINELKNFFYWGNSSYGVDENDKNVVLKRGMLEKRLAKLKEGQLVLFEFYNKNTPVVENADIIFARINGGYLSEDKSDEEVGFNAIKNDILIPEKDSKKLVYFSSDCCFFGINTDRVFRSKLINNFPGYLKLKTKYIQPKFIKDFVEVSSEKNVSVDQMKDYFLNKVSQEDLSKIIKWCEFINEEFIF